MTVCRFCSTPLAEVVTDLGVLPLSNALVAPGGLGAPETFYPLVVWICHRCFLVQTPLAEKPERIFSADYPYFSSYSDDCVRWAREYFEAIRLRLDLGPRSQVVEIASNDGYLLQNFVNAGIPALGIEPAANVAAAARAKGIESRTEFFGSAVGADINGRADLLIANNVLAHVPEINDFVEGFRLALAPAGTITIEFPHLLQIIRFVQFDTMYHEHMSYLSLHVVQRILEAHGLAVTDVEEIPSHGGSLRVYAQHRGAEVSARVEGVLAKELEFGLDSLDAYRAFNEGIARCRRSLLRFLIDAREEGKQVAGYGAPAKASTLFNYCGVRSDLLSYTVDRSPHKQGLYLPGVRIPIFAPEKLAETRPDYVLILPWNLRDEIVAQMAHVREWGGRFVVAIPRTEVVA
jgi:SAM-dependent methyltransferase